MGLRSWLESHLKIIQVWGLRSAICQLVDRAPDMCYRFRGIVVIVLVDRLGFKRHKRISI